MINSWLLISAIISNSVSIESNQISFIIRNNMLITKKSSVFLLHTAFLGLLGMCRPGFVGAFQFEDDIEDFLELLPEELPKGISLFGPKVLSIFFRQDIPRTCFEFEGVYWV